MIAHLKGREQALETFGWTGRHAEWIALASLHSGVFTRAQVSDWLGVHPRTARRFVRAMMDRRLAARDAAGGLNVCRICARGVYRALGAEDIRHRRTASTEVLLRRLLSLDYVIEHADLPWLPTEDEKVGAFEALGIERGILPARVYRGAAGNTRRHFPVKLPVALDARRAVFVYADPSHGTSTALRSWGRAHHALWEALGRRGRSVEAVAVVRTVKEFERCRTILGNWTRASDAPGPSEARESGEAARREIARIEQAIRDADDTVVAEHGGLQGCLVRIVELKDRLRSVRPTARIDRFEVWRSKRLAGGVS